MKKFTFIDLFAGIGGFRIAMEAFGGECVFSSEIDKFARLTYTTNFKDIPMGDITKIVVQDIPKHDVLCAGFPCQSFSISGKQTGFDNTSGTLFFEIARIADFLKPKVIFLENVANLRKHNDGKSIQVMASIIESLGYRVNYKILNASDFGVPQSRKRIYFVCFREGLDSASFKFPNIIPENQCYLEDILLPNTKVKKYFLNLENKTVVFKDKLETIEYKKRPIRIGIINKGGQGDRIYSPKGHAVTLSAYGGGSGAKTGAYLVEGVIRKLSPIECRRLQGFPEDYKIPVSDQQAWKQFGNSVAVPVLKAIIHQFIDYL